MILAVPKYILRGIAFGVSLVVSGFVVGVLMKSIADAWNGLGFVAFMCTVAFMGCLVYIFYDGNDWTSAAYALVAVLLMHLLMWGVGFYRTSR
jgi:hypothetical protein